MKAVAYTKAGPAQHLLDVELPEPKAKGHDILVEVQAIAVNPVDCKVRQKTEPLNGEHKVLGWDAVGIVRDVGDKVTLFKPGDSVWYAGDLTRPGCNSEYHLVDENIVGLKPQHLSPSEAAALPLTSLTAWELLFDRLTIPSEEKARLLITGAGGGVGSILTQLAKQLTSLTVIGTAGRPQSMEWIKSNGADHVINHQQPMQAQLNQLGFEYVDYVISLTHTEDHAKELVHCLKPQGKLALIDDPVALDIMQFKSKSISIHWEFMFTRSMYQTKDKRKQHEILTKVAQLVDQNKIKTTLNEMYGTINAANLQRAHQLIESGKSLGKIVLEGF